MDHQLSFADSELTNKRRQTRKEKFVGRMEMLIPWPRLVAVIEPHYPKGVMIALRGKRHMLI